MYRALHLVIKCVMRQMRNLQPTMCPNTNTSNVDVITPPIVINNKNYLHFHTCEKGQISPNLFTATSICITYNVQKYNITRGIQTMAAITLHIKEKASMSLPGLHHTWLQSGAVCALSVTDPIPHSTECFHQ